MPFPAFLDLTEKEKESLIESIKNLNSRVDELREKFFYYFLESNVQIKQLFKNTSRDKLQTMFNSVMAVMITNISDSELIQGDLTEIARRHRLYGVNGNFIPHFTSSMTLAMKDIFGTDPIVNLWLKIIHSTLEYFKTELK